ncbi:MAG: hypothetical protein ABW352_10885 [Polyangiales bacterium]
MMDASISCAVVCLRTSSVLELLEGASAPRIVELAQVARSLLQRAVPPPLVTAFARLGSERSEASFAEICFVSVAGAHVIRQLPAERAIVAVCASPERLGAVLSAARTHHGARSP